MFVDSHCHLSYAGLHERVPDIRRAMREARVQGALCICTTLEEFERVHELAVLHSDIWCTVGVHPDNEGVLEPSVQDLVTLASRERVVGLGESGLDYYRLNGRSVDEMGWQRQRFAVHIQAALATGLPLVVHTRSAAADTLAVLRSEGQGAARGVFHCFTESQDAASAALDLGFFISFSGILSFRNAEALREVARRVPLDRCLIETDSPYLAPMPHRGKTNQPAWVAHVASSLAQAKGLSLEAVAEATTDNFYRLFARAERPPDAIPSLPHT